MSEQDATLNEFTDGESRKDEREVGPPTEITSHPEDWRTVRLDTVAKEEEGAFVDGPFGSNLKADEMVEDGYARIIQLQNIRESEFADTNQKYISQEKFKELERHGAQPGDLAIAKMSEPVARACLLPDVEDQYLVVADCIKLSVDESNYNSLFVMLALNSEPVWKQAFARSRGSTRKRINLTQLKEVQIPSPSLEEQRKIASVLYTVDQAIQKNNEVISQTKRLKRGVMQDLFSEGYLQHKEHDEGNIRWKQVPSSWSLPKLSDVVEVNPRYDDIDRPVDYIEMDAVDTVLPEPEYIGKRNPAENSGRIFKKGDTLFARITPCTENGKICFVDNISSEIGIGSTEYAVLSPEKEELLPKYLYHYSRTHQVRNYAISRMRGSTGRQRVPFDVFRKELRIPMPPREEQKLIVEYLDSIDEVIRNGRQNKNQLQRLKQGLMQDLLSGEVRTHDKDIEIIDDVLKHG